MTPEILKLIDEAKSIVIIQAENPDGDSLGSSLALEEIFSEIGKEVSLYSNVAMPKYLSYLNGWDRVSDYFDHQADLGVIVDTVSDTLLSRSIADPVINNFLNTKPIIVFDHHGEVESSLPFDNHLVVDPRAVATSEMIYNIASQNDWPITETAAESMLVAILSDSLGLTTSATTASSFKVAGELVALGANPAELEARRRERMKKSPEILEYKGRLLGRIDYHLGGKLALVHIPWEEIEAYSDQYNPSVLVLDEMRLVEGVEVAIAVKTYPDGKLTGKLRCNTPVADKIAGYFGGGGHPYASGFRIFESYGQMLPELIKATKKALEER